MNNRMELGEGKYPGTFSSKDQTMKFLSNRMFIGIFWRRLGKEPKALMYVVEQKRTNKKKPIKQFMNSVPVRKK